MDSGAYGVGPLARLSSVRPGDEVVVTAGDGGWRYRVVQVDRTAKQMLDSAQLFFRDGGPRLHLVACTGRYDPKTGDEANLVVVAERGKGGG